MLEALAIVMNEVLARSNIIARLHARALERTNATRQAPLSVLAVSRSRAAMVTREPVSLNVYDLLDINKARPNGIPATVPTVLTRPAAHGLRRNRRLA